MVQLIVGVKGTGKTKTLIEMVHTALDNSKGKVVCLEKSNKLRYDINYRARLVECDEYFIDDAQSLFGFVAGIIAGDHDVTDLFVDGALKIANNDIAAFETLVKELDKFSAKHLFNCVMTASVAPEQLPDSLRDYIK